MDVVHIKQKYRDRLLQIAFIGSTWSPQPEGERHGCALALEGKYLVSLGFNGPDRNARGTLPDCRCSLCTAKIVHAEENACLNAVQAGIDLSRCVAFVTKKPCDMCMTILKSYGIKLVFWLQDASGRDTYWSAQGGDDGQRIGANEKPNHVGHKGKVDRT